MPTRSLGPVLAAALVAAMGVLIPSPAASASAASASAVAAACQSADGVTVIVDYNEVGGPARAGCDPAGAGQSASQVFPDAGFSLEYHPRQPGYVCKVTGLPDDRPCLENDSFWSLWWSDGESGEWRFSNQGVGGLSVPDGGYIAFAWHEGGGNAQPPDFVPTAHAEPVEPSDEPSDDGGGGSGDGSNTPGGNAGNDAGNNGGNGDDSSGPTVAPDTAAATTSSAGPAGSESATPERRKERERESADPTSAPTSSTSSSAVPGAAEITAGPPASDLAMDTEDDGGGALTTWVGLGLAVLVLGAAGLVTALRRRSG